MALGIGAVDDRRLGKKDFNHLVCRRTEALQIVEMRAKRAHRAGEHPCDARKNRQLAEGQLALHDEERAVKDCDQRHGV